MRCGGKRDAVADAASGAFDGSTGRPHRTMQKVDSIHLLGRLCEVLLLDNLCPALASIVFPLLCDGDDLMRFKTCQAALSVGKGGRDFAGRPKRSCLHGATYSS